MVRSTCLPGLGLLAAMSPAQQRSPFFSTVIGPDDKPIAGAEVTCVFTPDIVNPWETDVVRGTTDDRGRARCNLVVGRLYTVWAVGPADANGVACVSELVPLAASGRVFELRALDRQPPRRLQLVDLEPWCRVGGVGLRWFPAAGQDVFVDLPLPEADAVVLPPSPWAWGCLAVRDSSGELMVTLGVEPEAATLPAFAPPREVIAKVVDANGAPLAGVRVEPFVLRRVVPRGRLLAPFHGAENWGLRLLGITGTDGIVRGHVPTPADSNSGGKTRAGPQPMRVSKPGLEWQFKDVGRGGEVEFRLAAARTTAVSVRGADGQLVQFCALGTFQVRTDGGGVIAGQHPIEAACGNDGSWLVSGAKDGFTPRFSLSGAVPTAAVAKWIQRLLAERTIDLAECKVDVRVVDADGIPAPAALGIGTVSDGHPLYWDAVAATDVGGRAELRLPDDEYFVYATTGSEHALALVDQTSNTPLRLQLEPVPKMRVRVLDTDGQPVAGARAFPDASAGGGAGDPLTKQWGRLAFEMWWSYATQARSDENGVLQIPAFVRPGLSAGVRMRAGQRTSEPFALVPDGATEVTVRD